ncbi:ergothioneine biosynthesis protein EgtB [Massilia sp. W12]|uniref:ergothioneine biosynthesis protein EgtB n=1 Tax=Massilia sp. W12 TaxID=3126507 RepID=UPI0030D477EF
MGAAEKFQQVRQHTLALIEGLSAEDCCVQAMPDASPAKWHLAHTSWFFETFILARFAPGFQPFDAAYKVLFNSYYQGVGEQYPRPKRGLLTRPALPEVLAYRRHVEHGILQLLQAAPADQALLSLLELGLQHEQQHQELLLTDVKYLLSCNPLAPAWRVDCRASSPETQAMHAPQSAWRSCEGGLQEIGASGAGFCFDNELPRHTVYTAPFAIAATPVSNAQWLAFIEAGGYQEPQYWLAEGWDMLRREGWQAPLYWRRQNSAWQAFTLNGLQTLPLAAPVMHISYFEADAFARWAKARLPSEAEWEIAQAQGVLEHAFDRVWQWTQSSYAPYPGFQIPPGAVGEYNGKFMVNQYVLRGASLATPTGHARATYRNFFPASARWQFAGLRLARDLT